MDKEIQVSVIIPVYNGEKYIERCIKSILNQEFRNFEIIIINDGSNDDTGKICNSLANNDNRIKIVNQNNKGVSKSRAKGVEIAKGEYITFIDADDYIKKDFLSVLYKECKSSKIDIVCCNSIDCGEKSDDINKKIEHNAILSSKEEALDDFFEGKRYMYVIWGKFFRKECLKNLVYPNIKYTEDTYVMLELIDLNCKVQVLEYEGYYYYHNNSSVTFNFKGELEKYKDMFITYEFLYECCQKVNKKQDKCARERILDYLYSSFITCIKNKDDTDKFIQKNFNRLYKKIEGKPCRKYGKWIILKLLKNKTKIIKKIYGKVKK